MQDIYDEFGRIKPHPNLDTSGISYEGLSESTSEAKKYALKRIAYLRSLYDEYMRLHQEWIKLKAEYEKYVALNNVLQLENLKQKAKRFVLLNPMLQDKDHATAEELLGEMAKSIEKIEAEFSKYYLEYMEYKDKYVKEAMDNNVRALSHTKALAQNFFYNFEIDDFEKHKLLEIKHIDKDRMHTKLFNCAFSASFYPTEVRNAGTTTKVAGWGALEFCRAFGWNQAIYQQMGLYAHRWLMSNYMNGFLKVWLNSERARQYGTPDTSYPFKEKDFKGMFGDIKFPTTLYNVQLGNSYYDVDFTLFYHPIDTGARGTPHFGIISVEDVTDDENVYKYPTLVYEKPIQHFGPDGRNNHDGNYMWWWTHFGVKLSFDYEVVRQRKRQEIQQSIINKALESREAIEYATEAVKQAQRDYNYKKALNQITDLRNARRSAKRWLLSSPYMNFTNFTPANFKELDLPTMQELDSMVLDTEAKRDKALVSLESTQKHNNIVGLLNARNGALSLLHKKELVSDRDFIEYTSKELFDIFHAFNNYKKQYECAIMKVNINHFLNARADVKQFMHIYPMWSKWFYIEPKPIAPPPAIEPEFEAPQEPEAETPPVIEEVEPPIELPEPPQDSDNTIELESQETPDSHSGEPNFTDEELELLVMYRYVYERYKFFSGELMEMMQPSDENFGWNAHEGAVDTLYPTMRKDIELAKQKDPAPKLRAMAMDYNVDSFKEMVLHIKRINENMGIPVMLDWFEEAPTLVAETEQQADMVEMVNQILPTYFMHPHTIQEYLFSLMLNSLGGRGFDSWYQMLEVVEHYVIDTYEDCVWFGQNLANTPLSKIEKNQYVQHTASTPAYKKLDDTQKRECASFLLAQALMSINMNPNTKKTKEQILAEIKVMTFENKLDQIAEDYFNHLVNVGSILTRQNFNQYDENNMLTNSGGIIMSFSYVLLLAGKNYDDVASVVNGLFAKQGVSKTTKAQNIRIYRKIKELFLALENG